MSSVLIGYEVGNGDPVEIPIGHMVVTGQTQAAGKTTALEAMIARSGLRAISFVTKRGEGSFTTAARIDPYFRARADWQFVASMLEATMQEKFRYERPWIVRVTKGARTLADVRANIKAAMIKSRGGQADMYMMLNEYLDIVLDGLSQARFASTVRLAPGINVMDLAMMPVEVQGLVIASVVDWIHERERETVVIIPEAWEVVPEARGSPAKLAVETLIRKGGANHNFVWLDGQDIAGISKNILRSCHQWVLGVQRERNEVARVLAHIPAGPAKPKPDQIMGLGKGMFYVSYGQVTRKVYVRPVWMTAEQAVAIARGSDEVPVPPPLKPAPPAPRPSRPVRAPKAASTPTPTTRQEDDNMTEEQFERLATLLSKTVREAMGHQTSRKAAPVERAGDPATGFDEDALYERLLARLKQDPVVMKLLDRPSHIIVTGDKPSELMVDANDGFGRVTKLLVQGFFKDWRAGNAVFVELQRLGVSAAKPSAYNWCDKLTTLGFLEKHPKTGYRAVAGLEKNITFKK